MNIAQGIIYMLRSKWGLSHAFAVGGGAALSVHASASEQMRVVNTVHESGAVFAADGYYRSTKKLALAIVTSGPGLVNSMTALENSSADNIPLLLVSGQVSTRHYGHFAFQELSVATTNAVDLVSRVCKESMEIQRDTWDQQAMRAVKSAATPPNGPVHLSLPIDVALTEIGAFSISSAPRAETAVEADSQTLERAVATLLGARKTAIIVGHGVVCSRTGELVEQVSELLDAVVVATPKARSSVRASCRNFRGVFGFPGNEAAIDEILNNQTIDVVLILGSRLGQWSSLSWDTRIWAGRAVIWVDLEPRSIAGLMEPDVMIVGELAAVLRRLSERLAQEIDDHCQGPELPVPPTDHGRERSAPLAGLLHPIDVVRILSDLLPSESDIFVDIGNSMLWMIPYFRDHERYRLHVNLGFGCMGFATAGVVGAAAGREDSISIAVVGDGAFLMNGNEVATAVRYKLPALWIVLNDGGFRMLDQVEQSLFGRSVTGSVFPEPVDIAAMALGLGSEAGRATSKEELQELVLRGLAAHRPFVVDVRVDGRFLPPSLTTRVDQLRE